jgi:organic hydroperoxide reductase OsmC/OhrA
VPGSGRPGTNPEQLFAVCWLARFMGAMGPAAKKMKMALPADAAHRTFPLIQGHTRQHRRGHGFSLRRARNSGESDCADDTGRRENMPPLRNESDDGVGQAMH